MSTVNLKKQRLSGTLMIKNGACFFENKRHGISRIKLNSTNELEAILEIRNKFPEVSLTASKPTYSIENALLDWKETKSPSEGNYDFKERAWRLFKEATGINNLSTITGSHVQKYIKYLKSSEITGVVKRKSKKRTLNTVAKYVGACKTVFNATIDFHTCPINPFSRKGPTVSEVKKATLNRQPFTEFEIKLLIDNMNGWMKVVAVIGKFTGLRFGDVIKMEWERVSFEKQMILPMITSKRGRWVNGFPIVDSEFWSIMNNWKKMSLVEDEEGKYLFPIRRAQYLSNRTKSYPVGDWNRVMKRYVQCFNESGRKIKGFHSFRSFAVTYLRNLGMSDGDIIKFTGHADVKMLEVYDNPHEEERVERAKQLDDEIKSRQRKLENQNSENSFDLALISGLARVDLSDDDLKALSYSLHECLSEDALKRLAKLLF